MAVLTLAGKPINWSKPPKPTTRVKWSGKTTGGKIVEGSFRSICHLDRLNSLALKKFGVGIQVIQSAYNKSVALSKGTHDFDACFDVWIPGVAGLVQQAFFRANGAGAYYRTSAQGFREEHIHYFCLPPRMGNDVSQDYMRGGFKVGYFVDGGWSTEGHVVGSSQIADYYGHKNALVGHAPDPTWFPSDIEATIFDLDAYLARQVAKTKGPDQFALLNSHGPLARLGGAAGEMLWTTWEINMRKRADHYVKDQRLTTFVTSDTNKHGALPDFGTGLKRIGGKGIDLIARRLSSGGAKVEVLKHKVIQLHVDGHDGYGTQVRVKFPSGGTVKFWLVQANIGRCRDDQEFLTAVRALKKEFGKNAVYGFDEIDEGDVPNEHALLAGVFPKTKGFTYSGWSELSPVVVGPVLKIHSHTVSPGCPGKAKVTPPRTIVETVFVKPGK